MTEELKPCPFCGTAPSEYDQIGYSSVKCHTCKFSIKVRSEDGPPYAPEIWNRRATLSPAHIEDGEKVEVVMQKAECQECKNSNEVYDVSGEGPWSCYACSSNQEPVGYANFNELDSMLDDRTATISPVKNGWYRVPLYRAALSAPPAAVPAELTNVRCMCGDEYPHDSYGAGFIAGSGMCENCDAAIPAKEPPAVGVSDGLNRTREQWRAIDANLCSRENSQAANFYLIRDAKQDIERLHRALSAAPTPPASEQQRAVVMPEKQVEYVGDRDHRQWASGANWMLREFLRLNPHLAKGEGV